MGFRGRPTTPTHPGGPEPASRSSVVERFERSVVADQHDRLGLPAVLVTTHARRAGRHSSQSEAHGVGSCLKQGNHRTYRDVAFNNVTVDQGGVTRIRFGRNPHLCFEGRKTRVLPVLDRCSVVL